MTAWTNEEVAKIGDAEELDIASRRLDGNLRPFFLPLDPNERSRGQRGPAWPPKPKAGSVA